MNDEDDGFILGPKLAAKRRRYVEKQAKNASGWRKVTLSNFYNPRTGQRATGYGRYRRRRYGRYGSRRRQRRYRGRGGYWDDAWGKIGGFFGGYAPGSEETGKAVGNDVWDAGKSIIGKYTGLGYYNRRAYGRGAYNSGMGDSSVDQSVPIMSNPGGSDGPVCIRHREYIGDVKTDGTSNFQMLFNMPLNAGSNATFPWLSQIAANFTQFKVCGAMFHFKSTSGSLSTTQALGEIIMAVNYNTTDAAFTNKQQMLNEVFSVSKVPAFDAECPIECADNQTALSGLLYINNGPIPSGQDPRFFNLGQFYLACQGVYGNGTDPVTLGELWVTYQIELYKPQLSSNSSGGVPTSSFHMKMASTSAAPLTGGVILHDDFSLNAANPVVFTGNVLKFPGIGAAAGKYLLTVQFTGDSTLCTMPTITLSDGFSAGQALYKNQSSTSFTNSGTTCTTLTATVSVSYDGTYGSITFGTAGTIPANLSSADLTLTMIDHDIV